MLNFSTSVSGSRAASALLGIALSLLLCGHSVPAFASDTFKIIPAVTARETYDSNVYMMGKGDLEHRVVPSLKLDLQEERYRGSLTGGGTIYKYTKLNSYDRVDQSYDGLFEVDVTERLKVNFTAGAKVDHTFTETLADTGKIAQMILRRVYNFQPSVSYNVTERNVATLFSGYSKITYGSTTYTDSTANTFGGRWAYGFDERTQLIAQLSSTQTEAKTGGQQTVVTSLGGFEYSLTETIKARLLAGSSSMSSTTAAGKTSSSRGMSADSSVQWQAGETSYATAAFNRDMTSGLNGEDIVRTRFSFNASRRLTERFQVQLNANTVLSKTTGSSVAEQTTRWTEVSPVAEYQTSEYSTVSLGCAFGVSKTEETNESKRRSQVFLNFSISFPEFLQ
ncbi:MAG: hypothetical protein FD177_1376 [Desulfovibrionaceae bacterium]|nr:MAG: hypothetical protein FD177_1376 [Desulfovibrionaceae bacterium]